LAGFRVLLEAPAGLVAVDPWHHDVEQDEQWVYPASHLDGALPAASHEQPVPPALERVAQNVKVGGVVVDQQDPVGGFGGRGWGFVHATTRSRFLTGCGLELAAQLV